MFKNSKFIFKKNTINLCKRLFKYLKLKVIVNRVKFFLSVISLITSFIITGCDNQADTTTKSINQQSSHYLNNKKTEQQKIEQDKVKNFAKNLQVSYEVLDNRPDKDCDKALGDGNCFLAQLSLKLTTPIELKNWRIYFSFMTPIQQDYSEEFNIVHYNGDLHYLEPTDLFVGWQKTNNIDVKFKATFWQISEFDVPPNFYLVVGDNNPIVIDSTQSIIDPDTQQESLPFVKPMTDAEKQFKRSKDDLSEWASAESNYQRNLQQKLVKIDVKKRIIPKPIQLEVVSESTELDISEGFYLQKNDFLFKASNPAFARLSRLGVAIQADKGVQLNIINTPAIKGDESYQLNISAKQIDIFSATDTGAFYGLQSIASLIDIKHKKLPILKVNDQPRFEFRGFHLDVARNFRSKKFILKLLDQMAAYKLNKLHLHLGDDEGWRLEINGLPELTQVGAFRCHDLTESSCLLPQLGSGPSMNNENSGFYSLGDYQQILQAAQARNIEVIPSFDMPGHSRAAVKSMEARYKKYQAEGKVEYAEEYLLSDLNDKSQYRSVQFYNDNTLNVCRESTYHFVEKVIDEVVKLHQQAGVPLKTYHIGADETAGAWKASPLCKAFIKQNDLKVTELSDYFIRRVSALLAQRNIQVAGWSDGIGHIAAEQMPANVQANAWTPLFWQGHKVAHTMANKNWKVVVSVPDVTYFDFPYAADPKERGYYWGSRFTNTRQIFNFMPENLPLHAEVWTDRQGQPYLADDRHSSGEEVQPDKQESIHHQTQAHYQPLMPDKRFYGIQGHLWGEMTRSDELAEYMIFPRLVALAERAWHRAAWEPEYDHSGRLYSSKTKYFPKENQLNRDKSWNEFANALAQKELAKMDIEKLMYRIPTVGGIVKENKLFINSPFPGLILEYRLDEQDWQVYPDNLDGIKVKQGQTIWVRAKSPDRLRAGRALRVKNIMTALSL
ncbi:family 20 glycosylhydrolase [Aliikangiella sp. IMCC44359]|uniref:family 20 glycosylhydrolase n=1 Tax=Aliikangiella sp. IMCC44359 TaxID=3459125 RepID=UPI00403AFC1F